MTIYKGYKLKKGPFGWFGIPEKEDVSKDRFGYTQNFNSRIELEAWIDEHVETTELRRKLDYMPFDRDGMHSTGYEVCLGGPYNLADWWYEYENENGDIYYFR